MPGPPTPVSGCPLKRLEIRDGTSTRTYNSTRPTSVYTLTLEGERSIDMETGTLVLFIHKGQQRMISIRLSELSKTSVGARNAVGIDKKLLRLGISMLKQNQAVIAQFEERRDFSVAVCMLQKARFYINESISSIIPSSISAARASSPQTVDTTTSLGPRLSSITPLPRLNSDSFGDGLNQATTSFTSLLNSPLSGADMEFSSAQARSMPSPQPQIHQRMYSLPTYSDSSSPFFEPSATELQLDPYSIFGGNANPYRPRVSSPLKISFRPGEPTRHSSFEPTAPHNSVYLPAIPAIPAIPTVNSSTSSKEGFGKVEERDFRDLMPRPRRLPFDSDLKRQEQPKMTSPKATSTSKGHRDTCNISEVELFKEQNGIATIASPRETSNAESQTEMDPEVPCATCPPRSAASLRSPPREFPEETERVVIITDPNALREVNQSTARLFEQYTADVAGGSDEVVTAKFYLSQIQEVRRNFWYTKLIEMERAKLVTLA